MPHHGQKGFFAIIFQGFRTSNYMVLCKVCEWVIRSDLCSGFCRYFIRRERDVSRTDRWQRKIMWTYQSAGNHIILQSSCVDGLPRKRDENMIKEIINLRIFVKSKDRLLIMADWDYSNSECPSLSIVLNVLLAQDQKVCIWFCPYLGTKDDKIYFWTYHNLDSK